MSISLHRETQSKRALRIAALLLVFGLILAGMIVFNHDKAVWIYSATLVFLAGYVLAMWAGIRTDSRARSGWSTAIAIMCMALAMAFGFIIRMSFNFFIPL